MKRLPKNSRYFGIEKCAYAQYGDHCFSCDKEGIGPRIMVLHYTPSESANLAISCPHLRTGTGYMVFELSGSQVRDAEDLEGRLTNEGIRKVLREGPLNFKVFKNLFSDNK